MEFLSFPSTLIVGILALSLHTLEFLSYPLKHWNSGPIFLHIDIIFDLILQNIATLALSLYPLKSLSYPSEHWKSGLILLHIGILISSFQTLILAIFYKHWTSYLILALQTEILALSFQTLEFFSLFIHIGFLILSFKTSGFWPNFN